MNPPLRSSTVADVIRRSASTFRDRPAVIFEDRTWSYRELDDAVSRAAAHLLHLGLMQGDRVASFGLNSDAYLIGFLACARAGLVHVPLNNQLVGRELDYLLGQSGARGILVDPALAPRLDQAPSTPDIRVPLRDADDSLLAVASTGEVPRVASRVDTEDLAQLLYTSGTTSRPKGAMMTHRALVHEYVSCIIALDLSPDDAPLHVMPLYHSAQMHVFLLPWLAVGATNTIMEKPDAAAILERMERDGHRAFFAAPTLWVSLANHPDFATRDLSALRKAYYGASIMPGPIRERIAAKLPELGWYNCFGQSEIAPLSAVLRPEEHAQRPSSAGRPVFFVEMRVVAADGSEAAPGEPGEIQYRSPQLCEGYWDEPQESAAAFEGEWFHSGDLVTLDEEGYITVVDRVKDVINTGGVIVASREIEDAIYTHPQVAEVAVIGQPDDTWIEAVTAFVVRRPNTALTQETVQSHVREQLAGFKVPKAVHFVDDLPRNASGKILKRELRR